MLHHVSRMPGLGFLQFVPQGAVYLINDDVYVAPRRGRRDKAVRIGSLTAHTKALVDQMSRVHQGAQGPTRQAREQLGQLPVLRFCLLELIPYLQSLQEPGTVTLPPPPEIRGMLDGMARHVSRVDSQSTRPRVTAPAQSELIRWFRTPSVILGQTVSPLEPGGAGTPTDFDVTIAEVRYRICLERARPLSELLMELNRRILLWSQGQGSVDGRHVLTATKFSREINKILDWYEPVDRGHYSVVYADRDHQLHHSCGRFLLVRGPVRKRNECGDIWVALELKGWSRSILLASAPHTHANPDMFWKGLGTPVAGGMCMGRREQYRHLHSNEFTDAEALVLWLDAGVILATGQSAFHRAWRGKSARGVAPAPATTVRRRLRRACS